ncbi:class I SAM-dependent methyltransferase [Rhodocytophaga aerolata]|uniref:Class I SAM-dependent methyltransferase n=1 Tax=Rhodocytophaga aerolata TaxID=455078 RepID=A0ABT8R415_9BACT|nr:class I SAM-dependent methyltransferase [Rhodocytophaga aerolata]MDO1446018.1 class I SAM-dependent methyltransferase [Rhodocytophaga aerolata]
MDVIYEKQYHQLEEDNWWFVARRDIVYHLFRELKLGKDKTILEIGCSGGPLMKELIANGYSQVYGMDISEKGISLAKSRGLNNVFVMDGTNPDFAPQSFDVIIASDVLEHIKDTKTALKNWYTLLKPGGQVIVFVPAFNFLWSQHDVINHHFQRYTEKKLIDDLKAAGFVIRRSSYWNIALFVPTYLFRLFQKIFGSVDGKTTEGKGQLVKMPHLLNQLLVQYIKLENKYLTYYKSPFGVSVFAIAYRGK